MKRRYMAILLLLACVLALLNGCGTGREKYTAMSAAEDSDEWYAEEAFYPAEADEYWAGEIPAPAPDRAAQVRSTDVPAASQNPAKLIYTAELEMETLDFDGATAALAALTEEVGGYYESSSVSNSGSTRRAAYTVRVPAENYRAFVDGAGGELCHVLSVYEYTEDVSELYYDTSGRLETQKTKLTRLQELLLQAEDMEDIIVLEDAISETEEQIDRLSGTLRHYDALVDYSTVTITLREVKVYEPEPDPTYGTRLSAAFTQGLKGFVEGLGNILLALAYSWMWLLLLAAVVVLVLWLTRKRRGERRRARAERKALREAQKHPEEK